MSYIGVLIEKRKLNNIKHLLESKNLTHQEIEKAFKRKDLSLEEILTIALNNNREDVIKGLTDEQINELIYSPVDMTRYQKIAQQTQKLSLDKRCKLFNNKDKNFTQSEIHYLKSGQLGSCNLKDDMLRKKHDVLIKSILILGKEDKLLKVAKQYEKQLSDYTLTKDNQILDIKDFSKYIFTLLENEAYFQKEKSQSLCFILPIILVNNYSTHVNELKQLINSDENFKDKFFSNIRLIAQYLNSEIYAELGQMIYQNPEVQKQLQNSKDAFELCKQKAFFENLLPENKSLIAYYDQNFITVDEKSYEQCQNTMKEFFQKYYGNMLTEYQQEEITEYIFKGDSSQNSNKLVGRYTPKITRRENIEYLLKQSEANPEIFAQIDSIKNNLLSRNLSNAIDFTKRYGQTQLYVEVLQKIKTGNIDNQLQEKIQYLAKRNKLLGIDSLQDLEGKTMDELRDIITCLEPMSELMKSHSKVSGDQTTKRIIFDVSREIVTISRDGKENFIPAPSDHTSTLKVIYHKKLETNQMGGYEVASEVARKLGDVLLVTEGNTLLMYFPKNITTQQKAKFKEIMNTANLSNDIQYGASIIDGENTFDVDFETYDKKIFTSDKFLGGYLNVIDENNKEQEANSMSKITRQALEEYEPTR